MRWVSNLTVLSHQLLQGESVNEAGRRVSMVPGHAMGRQHNTHGPCHQADGHAIQQSTPKSDTDEQLHATPLTPDMVVEPTSIHHTCTNL